MGTTGKQNTLDCNSVLWSLFFLSVCIERFIWVYIGEGNGTPLHYSCLENSMDGGAWWAAVHGVARSRTWLSYFTFTFHFPALEKEMATHSSVLAWRIPGTGEPGGLPSMGSHRVGHDWSDLAAAAAWVYMCNIFVLCMFRTYLFYLEKTREQLEGPRRHGKYPQGRMCQK